MWMKTETVSTRKVALSIQKIISSAVDNSPLTASGKMNTRGCLVNELCKSITKSTVYFQVIWFHLLLLKCGKRNSVNSIYSIYYDCQKKTWRFLMTSSRLSLKKCANK